MHFDTSESKLYTNKIKRGIKAKEISMPDGKIIKINEGNKEEKNVN